LIFCGIYCCKCRGTLGLGDSLEDYDDDEFGLLVLGDAVE